MNSSLKMLLENQETVLANPFSLLHDEKHCHGTQEYVNVSESLK